MGSVSGVGLGAREGVSCVAACLLCMCTCYVCMYMYIPMYVYVCISIHAHLLGVEVGLRPVGVDALVALRRPDEPLEVDGQVCVLLLLAGARLDHLILGVLGSRKLGSS